MSNPSPESTHIDGLFKKDEAGHIVTWKDGAGMIVPIHLRGVDYPDPEGTVSVGENGEEIITLPVGQQVALEGWRKAKQSTDKADS
jgi:hypothetical protein